MGQLRRIDEHNRIAQSRQIVNSLIARTHIANKLTPTTDQTQQLLRQFNINPHESISTTNLNGYKAESGFIPQNMLRGLTGKASAYAIANGDYFGGITFLAEGVRSNAFYFDPASGSRKGILINTHPGITLKYQSAEEMRRMFGHTSIRNMTEEIIQASRNGQMTSRMRSAQLVVADYYNMFKEINRKYSRGADIALREHLDRNSYAKALMAQGLNRNDIMTRIKQNLPAPSYAVLQHLSYKYGEGGIKRFHNLLDKSISAALDLPNQDKHLQDGARFIVYHYRNKNNQLIQDTRAMNIHRLFYTSGVKFSPELNMKLVTGGQLDNNEQTLVNSVAKSAGVDDIVKNGRISDFGSGSPRNSITDEYKLEQDGPVQKVNQSYKPPITISTQMQPTSSANKPHNNDLHGNSAARTMRFNHY